VNLAICFALFPFAVFKGAFKIKISFSIRLKKIQFNLPSSFEFLPLNVKNIP